MEEEISAVAAAEAIAILYNTDVSLVSNIPYAIFKALEDKAEEYTDKVNIDMNLSLAEQPISDEAQSILAILYKDYWCDSEKKQEMNKIIKEKSNEYDQEQTEKLNPFKDIKKESLNNNLTSTSDIPETALIEVPKKWYVIIFDKIMRFFRKK